MGTFGVIFFKKKPFFLDVFFFLFCLAAKCPELKHQPLTHLTLHVKMSAEPPASLLLEQRVMVTSDTWVPAHCYVRESKLTQALVFTSSF